MSIGPRYSLHPSFTEVYLRFDESLIQKYPKEQVSKQTSIFVQHSQLNMEGVGLTLTGPSVFIIKKNINDLTAELNSIDERSKLALPPTLSYTQISSQKDFSFFIKCLLLECSQFVPVAVWKVL